MQEWTFEPNQLKFTYEGFLCEIIRHDWGFLHAYIFIPENNILHGIDELALNSILKTKTEISYSQAVGGFWKIGFSFSSIKDFVPKEPDFDAPEFMVKMETFLGFTPVGPESYKNIEYAIAELKNTVDSINKISLKSRT